MIMEYAQQLVRAGWGIDLIAEYQPPGSQPVTAAVSCPDLGSLLASVAEVALDELEITRWQFIRAMGVVTMTAEGSRLIAY
jgi:hypothetical protein